LGSGPGGKENDAEGGQKPGGKKVVKEKPASSVNYEGKKA